MFRKRSWLMLLLTGFTVAALLLAAGCAPEAEDVEVEEEEAVGNGETLVFADFGWESAIFHNRVAQFIIEEGYGYETDSIPGETIPLMSGLQQGDVDIAMEIWIQNSQEAYDAGIESGDYVDLGTNFDDNEQGMYVPTYVIEGDPERDIEPLAPDLQSVEDLPEYWELFQDPEDETKGRFHSAIPGWEADEIMTQKFETYGLDENYNLFRPGSDAALAASLVSAYDNGEAWFGYYWAPTWVSGRLDLTLIEEPPFDQEQWDEDFGCAFPAVDVNVVVHRDVEENAPEIVEFLTLYESNSEITGEALAYMETEDASAEDTAKWFLVEYEDMWTQWVPEEVAEQVKAAL